jgi:hypothetical protein
MIIFKHVFNLLVSILLIKNNFITIKLISFKDFVKLK